MSISAAHEKEGSMFPKEYCINVPSLAYEYVYN